MSLKIIERKDNIPTMPHRTLQWPLTVQGNIVVCQGSGKLFRNGKHNTTWWHKADLWSLHGSTTKYVQGLGYHRDGTVLSQRCGRLL